MLELRGFRREDLKDAADGKDMVATTAGKKAPGRPSRASRLAQFRAPTTIDPRGQDCPVCWALLVAGHPIWVARRLLGRYQRDNRTPIQLRVDHYRIARSTARDIDRRGVRLFVFTLRRIAMELHPCRGCGDDCVWAVGVSRQFAAGRSYDHDRDAGAEWHLTLDGCARSRGTGCFGHRGGAPGLDAGF